MTMTALSSPPPTEVTVIYPDGTPDAFSVVSAMNFIDRLATEQVRKPYLLAVTDDVDLMRSIAEDHTFHLASLLTYTVVFFSRIAPDHYSPEHAELLRAMRLLRVLARARDFDLWPHLDAA